jgi:anaerobic ribonucleoside-triphosphate reductase activating protein
VRDLLKIADILVESVVDGKGLRTVIFFQGCPDHCEGCHNAKLLPFEGGKSYTPEMLAREILAKMTPIHKGVTFSGGDPLAQSEELLQVIKILRKEKPNLNIWTYTGYLFEEVKSYPVLKEIDVLVDGPFILSKRDISLPFRGSANQRIIDLPKTFATGAVQELRL